MKNLFAKKIAFLREHPKLDILFVLIGLALFSTIAFFNISNFTIWFDEAFSAYLVQFNFADIATYTSADVHPPLYYWLLKVWTMLFGTTEVAFRSLSILFGAGAITAGYLLARKFFGRLVAGVSLLFLTLSPMLIRYGDEARMYTLAVFIILLATHVLVKATESNKRRYWVLYGILVTLGMWTHYFTALAWIAHWVWRFVAVRKGTTKPNLVWRKFFSKDWISAHVIAVGLFLPWLPFMAIQLGGIQGTGFWIEDVGIDSFSNFFTNVFYFLEHEQVSGWISLLLGLTLAFIAYMAIRTYRSFNKTNKIYYVLIAALAFVPIIVLFVASLPPLRPSFVERYLLPAVIGFTIFAALTIVVGTRKWRPMLRVVPVVVIASMMIFGITNVYHYGNYNRNSGTHVLTRDLVRDIAKEAKPGEPIVANAPWVFYEAVFYETKDHPVYFVNETTDYKYGSLAMLKDNDQHKIKDLDAFMKEHPTIWYIGVSGGDLEPLRANWKRGESINLQSWLDGKTIYRANEFTAN